MKTLTLEINDPVTIQAIAAAAAQKGVTADAYALDLLATALHTIGAANSAMAGQPSAPANPEQFKAALGALSEGTEHLPATPSTSSREYIPAASAKLQAFLEAMAAGAENASVLPPEANERAFYYEGQG